PSQTLTWNSENWLSSVFNTSTGTTTESYVYDGDGKRVAETSSSEGTIHYVNRFYQKDVTSGTTTVTYWLGDRLVAVKSGSTLHFFHVDHLDSAAARSDAGGVGAWRAYLPYGEVRTSSGTIAGDRSFTGQRLDTPTGLYFYNARYYDPTIGRFISPDTIVPDPYDPRDYNRFAYVLNNPLKYTDPSGHSCSTDEWADGTCGFRFGIPIPVPAIPEIDWPDWEFKPKRSVGEAFRDAIGEWKRLGEKLLGINDKESASENPPTTNSSNIVATTASPSGPPIGPPTREEEVRNRIEKLRQDSTPDPAGKGSRIEQRVRAGGEAQAVQDLKALAADLGKVRPPTPAGTTVAELPDKVTANVHLSSTYPKNSVVRYWTLEFQRNGKIFLKIRYLP
ncbi:MAG: RHS repeat-associated core domain-containing protein, partial [Chloroflexi bacterium]|nr:RHS repeat-associated core domain-containing protein [Chloroflexota bacterium]